jgi:hypothetical protein
VPAPLRGSKGALDAPFFQMKAKLSSRDWTAWRGNVSMAVARYDPARARVAYDCSDDFLDFKQEAFADWHAPVDGLNTVFHSSLMNAVQLSSLYSTIGVRVHLRQALWSLGVRGQGRQNAAFVRMRAEVGRTIYFAPVETIRADTYRRNGRGAEVEARCARFCLADFDDAVTSYARHLDPLDLAAAAFTQMLAGEHTCELLAVELPVLNPFFLFAKPGDGRRFFFQQTQADFVARLVPAGEQTGPLVVGEYKTLMEVRGACAPLKPPPPRARCALRRGRGLTPPSQVNNPSARVDNVKNFRQVIAVARLFEAMTNLVVEYGTIIYYTRQLTAYVLTFPITRGDDFDAKLLEASLLAPLDLNLRSLYADGAHRASFKVRGLRPLKPPPRRVGAGGAVRRGVRRRRCVGGWRGRSPLTLTPPSGCRGGARLRLHVRRPGAHGDRGV